ncbi:MULTISPECIES: DedA family protein [Hymenobacter]|uniref:DedA family protein n=1 Tax=Hymenobacter jejuensis TaxID=2502781 RepID=A0A5B8A1X0_9BACT|nr:MULTISPECIES: DedA family protein [Hymenobacter]MBC6990935.1 DedA family protein [Hymenobacter sp. BT491]QDA60666.1 DedA family protein [Hymenobacter jejuensis]
MALIQQFFDLVLHLDKTLINVVQEYGGWTYLILFLIVFTETGVVIFPFLPGDSLLFVAGTLAAQPVAPGSEQTLLHLTYLIPLLFFAAFLGDNLNYFIGDYLGPRVFREDFKLLKRKYLEQTQAFYAKHGGKTIIMARFIPIVRTFAPFVAGVGTMKYAYFISYSVGGALLWVISLVMAGYLFGNIPVVKNNFTIVIYAIILISVMPPIFQFLKQKFSGRPSQA